VADLLSLAQIENETFRKIYSKFCAKEAIKEIMNVLKMKADQRKINV